MGASVLGFSLPEQRQNRAAGKAVTGTATAANWRA